MNNLPKRSIFFKKLHYDLNSEHNNYQNYIHSIKYKSNLLSQNQIRIYTSPNINCNKRRISLFKNYKLKNDKEEHDIIKSKSNSNLTRTCGNNESNHQHCSLFEFNNDNINTNLTKKNAKINIINSFNSIKKNKINNSNKKTLTISTNKIIKISNLNKKKVEKKYKYILSNREKLSNINKNSNDSIENKTINNPRKSPGKLLRTQKSKNIIKVRKNISFNEKNESNYLNYNKEKSKIILKHLLQTIPKNINNNNNLLKVESKKIILEKKYNLENKVKGCNNYFVKSPIKTKLEKINSKNTNLNIENIFRNLKARINKKELINRINRIPGKISRNSYNNNYIKNNNDILANKACYLENNELKIDLLSNTNEKSPRNKNRVSLINKVLYFNTESNNSLFNIFIKKEVIDSNSLEFDKTYENKKNEIANPKTINSNQNADGNIIKNGKNKYMVNKNSIYKNDLKKNINKKKNVTLLKNQIKKSYNKTENSTINKDHNLPLKKVIILKKNKNYIRRTNKIKYIDINTKIKKLLKSNELEGKNKLYELLKCNHFIKILFSFCQVDINLLNKISVISKDIFRKIKPLIYKKISNIIIHCHENINLKNKIKKHLMKNNSLLSTVSNSILYIKYNDLLLENNIYDLEIKKDLTRTFPKNILFKYGNIYYNKLYHILSAFSNLNKNIGYVQGINYIAAHIINIFENEIEGLIFLDSLINKFQLDKILDNNLNNEFYKKIFNNINSFIIKQMPKFDKFLSDIKLNIEFFTTNWILTLFADSIDTEFIVIIWDYMIIFGW